MSKDLRNPLWTALITPLTAQGEVDFPKLKTLVKRQEEAGNGLLILGSTGEGFNLHEKQRRAVLEFICEENPQIPLMVGVGGNLLETQMEWISFCNSLPIQAFCLITPTYSRPGGRGQLHWFTTLMNHSAHPCLIYNHPGRGGCPLNLQTVDLLRHHPRFWAIKEASGSIENFRAYKKAAPNIMLFSGNDDMIKELAEEGAHGLIAVMSNVWPHATRRYVEEAMQGKKGTYFEKGLQASLAVNKLNPLPCKFLLHKKGVIASSLTRPPLSMEDLPNPDELILTDLFMTPLDHPSSSSSSSRSSSEISGNASLVAG